MPFFFSSFILEKLTHLIWLLCLCFAFFMFYFAALDDGYECCHIFERFDCYYIFIAVCVRLCMFHIRCWNRFYIHIGWTSILVLELTTKKKKTISSLNDFCTHTRIQCSLSQCWCVMFFVVCLCEWDCILTIKCAFFFPISKLLDVFFLLFLFNVMKWRTLTIFQHIRVKYDDITQI